MAPCVAVVNTSSQLGIHFTIEASLSGGPCSWLVMGIATRREGLKGGPAAGCWVVHMLQIGFPCLV